MIILCLNVDFASDCSPIAKPHANRKIFDLIAPYSKSDVYGLQHKGSF
jgi:hypothetical protein